MGRITIIDDFNDKESILFANDEIDAIYDVVVTLLTNKYKDMDSVKIAEERISDSELYKVLTEISKELKNELGK